jgi:hypothetical protein
VKEYKMENGYGRADQWRERKEGEKDEKRNYSQLRRTRNKAEKEGERRSSFSMVRGKWRRFWESSVQTLIGGGGGHKSVKEKGILHYFCEIRSELSKKTEWKEINGVWRAERKEEDIKKGRETWEETGRKWEREKNLFSPI